MNSPQADRLLSRITALHKSLQLDPDQAPSALERDLMLGYLRELYDCYREAGAAPASPPPPKRAAAPPPPAPTPTPPPAPPPSSPPPVPRAPVPPPPAPSLTANVATVAPSPASPEIEELLAEQSGADLAARLGRQPISDLTRALTINNRVQFARDLFGGNTELLNTVLRDLNARGSMAAARPVIVDLAQRHDWADDGRRAAAREFIELVRRRYAH